MKLLWFAMSDASFTLPEPLCASLLLAPNSVILDIRVEWASGSKGSNSNTYNTSLYPGWMGLLSAEPKWWICYDAGRPVRNISWLRLALQAGGWTQLFKINPDLENFASLHVDRTPKQPLKFRSHEYLVSVELRRLGTLSTHSIQIR